jgi:hypothetical protein
MSFSGLLSLSSNVKSTKKANIIVLPLQSNWSLACGWLGGTVIGTYDGVIDQSKMTVTNAAIPAFIGDYTFTNGTMYNLNTGTLTTDYFGILGGPDRIRYKIPPNAFCTITYTMPVKVQIKKIYHFGTFVTTNVACVVRGSKDGGITWTDIASLSLTHLNNDKANVPTISSTDNFNMIKWDLTNTLGTATSIYHLDFVGDFYA